MSTAKKKTVQLDPPAPVPLNRKYRPQSFDSAELVGQEPIVRTLKNAIRSNRIASAYLFCGPRGTGKTSTARILAKAVNCLDPNLDNRPCNTCTSCAAINTGATPDVIEIDAASNRGIDDIRDLRDRVNYAPTQLRIKFYIIDEAHQITGAAANAFLKTLEEPPDHTKFILATTNPEELLPTIVSRCQRFDFRRHTPDGIAHRIGALAEREGINLSDDALRLIAELAHGSMRDPIGLLDQLASYGPESGSGDRELSADDVRELVGITHSEVALQVLIAISEGDAGSALKAINAAVQAGQDSRQLNRQIVSLIRDGLYIASGARQTSEEPNLQAAVERLSLRGLLAVAEAFADTDNDIRSAVIPQLPLEMAVLDAILRPAGSTSDDPGAKRSPSSSVQDATAPKPERSRAPLQATESVREETRTDTEQSASTRFQDMVRVRSQPKVSPAETTSASSDDIVAGNNGAIETSGDLTIDILIDMWPRIRSDIKSLDRRTEALLMEIDPIDVRADEIVLAATYEFHRDKVNEDDRRAMVEQVVGRRVGRPMRVHCVLRSEFAAQTRSPEVRTDASPVASEAVNLPNVEDAAHLGQTDAESADEKMLGAVVRMFDGEIIED